MTDLVCRHDWRRPVLELAQVSARSLPPTSCRMADARACWCASWTQASGRAGRASDDRASRSRRASVRAQDLVALMGGGALSRDSAPGEGSTFSFWLPIDVQSAADIEPARTHEASGEPTAAAC